MKKGEGFSFINAAIITVFIVFLFMAFYPSSISKTIKSAFGIQETTTVTGQHPLAGCTTAECSMQALKHGIDSLAIGKLINNPSSSTTLSNSQPSNQVTTAAVTEADLGIAQTQLPKEKDDALVQLRSEVINCWNLFKTNGFDNILCKHITIPNDFNGQITEADFKKSLCEAGEIGVDLCGQGLTNPQNYDWRSLGTISSTSAPFFICADNTGTNEIFLTRNLADCPAEVSTATAAAACSGVSFGQACVICNENKAFGSDEQKISLAMLGELVKDCFKQSESASVDTYCAKINPNTLESTLTKQDLENWLTSNGGDLGKQVLADANVIMTPSPMINDPAIAYYICADDDWTDSIKILDMPSRDSDCKQAYDRWNAENTHANGNTFQCTVKDFRLPQHIESSALNYIAGYGDPYYLAYYEKFPEGEETHWEISPIGTLVKGVAIGAGLNVIFNVLLPGGGGKKAVTEVAEQGGKAINIDAMGKVVASSIADSSGRSMFIIISEQFKSFRDVIVVAKKTIINELFSSSNIGNGLKLTERLGKEPAKFISDFVVERYQKWYEVARNRFLKADGSLSELGYDRLKKQLASELRYKGIANADIEVLLSRLDDVGLTEFPLGQVSRKVAEEAAVRVNLRRRIIDTLLTRAGEIDAVVLKESLEKSRNILTHLSEADAKLVLERVSTWAPASILTEAGEINMGIIMANYPWLKYFPAGMIARADKELANNLVVNRGTLTSIMDFAKDSGARLYQGSLEGLGTTLKSIGKDFTAPLSLLHPVSGTVKGALRTSVTAPVKIVNWGLTHPYSFALGMGLLMSYYDSKNQKLVGVGGNSLGLLQPMGISEKQIYDLQPQTSPFFIQTFKDSDRNSVRFYAASPCKADLTLTKAKCKCSNSKDPQYDYYNFGSGYIPVGRGTMTYDLSRWGQEILAKKTDKGLIKATGRVSVDVLEKDLVKIYSDMETIDYNTDCYLEILHSLNRIIGRYWDNETIKGIVEEARSIFNLIVFTKLDSISSCTDYESSIASIAENYRPYAYYIAGKCYELMGNEEYKKIEERSTSLTTSSKINLPRYESDVINTLVQSTISCWKQLQNNNNIPCTLFHPDISMTANIEEEEFRDALDKAGSDGDEIAGADLGLGVIGEEYEWDIGTLTQSTSDIYMCGTDGNVILTINPSRCYFDDVATFNRAKAQATTEWNSFIQDYDKARDMYLASFDLKDYIPEPPTADDPSDRSTIQVIDTANLKYSPQEFVTVTLRGEGYFRTTKLGFIRQERSDVYNHLGKINPASIRVVKQGSHHNLPYQSVWYADGKASLYWNDYDFDFSSSWAVSEQRKYDIYYKEIDTNKDYIVFALFDLANNYLKREDYANALKYYQFVIDYDPEGYIASDISDSAADKIEKIIMDPVKRDSLYYNTAPDKESKEPYWITKYDYVVDRYSQKEKDIYKDLPFWAGATTPSMWFSNYESNLGWTLDDYRNWVYQSNQEALMLFTNYYPVYHTNFFFPESGDEESRASELEGVKIGYFESGHAIKHLLQIKKQYLGTRIPYLNTIDTYNEIVQYHHAIEADNNIEDDTFEQLTLVKKAYYESQLLQKTYTSGRQDTLFNRKFAIDQTLSPLAVIDYAVKECPTQSWWSGIFNNEEFTVDCIRVTAARDSSYPNNFCYSDNHPWLESAKWITTVATIAIDILATSAKTNPIGLALSVPVTAITGAISSGVFAYAEWATTWPRP
ncbi:MAG: tetratricopeptide repeat protein [Nanoarchaeota archaeon]